jgi:HK97 family phage prohead protease
MTAAAIHEQRGALLEIRARGRRLEGHAALFDKPARIENRFTETVCPGAFSRSLKSGADVLALVDHAPDKLLGRTRSGTLRLSEDTRGLAFSVDLPQTQLAHDVLELVQRGDAGGMSFGFTAIEERWRGDQRELHTVQLHEVSVILSFPAYEGTTVSARSRANKGGMPAALARAYLETLGA